MSLRVDLELLVLGGLALTRVVTFLMALPGLDRRSVPPLLKIAIGVWLTVAILPTLPATLPFDLGPGPLALALAGEVLLGFLMAFSVGLLFAAVQLAGQVVGVQTGLSLGELLDPQTQPRGSLVGQTYYLLAILIFVAVDGPLRSVEGLVAGFAAVPPAALAHPAASVATVLEQAGAMFGAALRIGAPVIVTLLLVSLTLGVLGRTVPQLNVLVVGFPLKILAAVLVLAASVTLLGDAMVRGFADLPERILRVTAGG